MTILKTHPHSVLGLLGLLGLSPSRRHRSTRIRRRPLPLGVERFEDRVVPATVTLLNAATPVPVEAGTPASSLYLDNNLKFGVMNHEICVTFELTDATNLPAGGVPVSLSSYTIASAGSSTTQTLLTTQTAHLTTVGKPVTLCVEVDDDLCDQVDAYYLGNVTGAIFHPTFTNSGATFVDEGTNLSDTSLQQKIAQDCNTAIIGNYGLTIGFWKNHTANWQVYSPDTTLGSVFPALNDAYYQPGQTNPYSSLANLTFAEALSLGGGPSLSDQAGLLLKQAVGGLLNASAGTTNVPPGSQVGYALTTGQITAQVDFALASMDPNAIGTLQGQFDSMNSVDVAFNLTNPVNTNKK